MSSDTVVPNDDCSRCPLDSGLDILRIGDMIIQESQECVRFFLLVSRNTSHELLVHKQSLLTGGWVCPDYRMSVGDGITSNNAATSESILCLLMGRVNSLEAVQTLLERWRQSAVGFCLVDETGITTR